MTRLNEILAEAGLQPLSQELMDRFHTYLVLLLKWNAKLNLTAIRSQEGILRRHFVECIFCAQHLPDGKATVLDYGSGAGFPGLPIAMCRPEYRVTLAESQSKKCAFLRECSRSLEVSASVYCGRAEELSELFDVVAMRAVERMGDAVVEGAKRVSAGGTLVLMTTESESFQNAIPEIEFAPAIRIPLSEHGILLMGKRGQ